MVRSSPPSAHVLIVGGGGTGGALAHDLSLRGVKVTLVERGELTSGTTGRPSPLRARAETSALIATTRRSACAFAPSR